MEIIITLITTWGPALVAVLGVVSTVLVAIGKTKDAVESLKQDATFKSLAADLQTAITQNETLREQNDLLLDEITKIKDYRENQKKGA